MGVSDVDADIPKVLLSNVMGMLAQWTEEDLGAVFSAFVTVQTHVCFASPDREGVSLDQFRIERVAATRSTSSFVFDTGPAAPPIDAGDPPSDDDIAGGVAAPDFEALFQAPKSNWSGSATRKRDDVTPSEDTKDTFLHELLSECVNDDEDLDALHDEILGLVVDDLLEAEQEAEDKRDADLSLVPEPSSSSAPAAQASSSSSAPAAQALPPNRVMDPTSMDELGGVLTALQLENRTIGAAVMQFADAKSPFVVVLTVHAIGRAVGESSLKATCKRHKSCQCWVTKFTNGSLRFALLRDLLVWGAEGREFSEADHARTARDLKIEWGMKPRS